MTITLTLMDGGIPEVYAQPVAAPALAPVEGAPVVVATPPVVETVVAPEPIHTESGEVVETLPPTKAKP